MTPLREGFPPGPPPRKGVLPTLRYVWGFATDPIGFVGRRFDTYGDIYHAPGSPSGLYVLRKPQHIHEVLVTRASSFGKKHSAFTQLSRVLGDGLLVSEGEAWKRARRMVQPGFAPSRMAGYGVVMAEEARRTAAAWRDGQVLRLESQMTALTLRIVSRTLFGHDVSDDDIRTIARGMTSFQRSLTTDFLPSWLPTPNRLTLQRSLADLDRIVYRLIRERRSDVREPRDEGNDLLQMLVSAVDPEASGAGPGDSRGLDEREVRDQLVTLFLAGHETTSQALTWAFYCLSRAPDAERALHAELDRVLGDREPTYADLENLPYTEKVLLEAMRLYPPVHAVVRCASEDTEIDGWRVPRGSEVAIWIYMTHRDPSIYPEPEAFRPERFDEAEASARPRLAYLPFGAGPRACIGRTFAMVEAKLILATLARRHRLSLAQRNPVVPRPMITLTPKNGIRMHVERRRATR